MVYSVGLKVFWGAAVGGAVGGVAGVAAGAAIGAQVKMLREALGATAEYAAELRKLEIALEGVTEGKTNLATRMSFQAWAIIALKAANHVTKDFNIPIAVSTKGITRLSQPLLVLEVILLTRKLYSEILLLPLKRQAAEHKMLSRR